MFRRRHTNPLEFNLLITWLRANV